MAPRPQRLAFTFAMVLAAAVFWRSARGLPLPNMDPVPLRLCPARQQIIGLTFGRCTNRRGGRRRLLPLRRRGISAFRNEAGALLARPLVFTARGLQSKRPAA